MNSGTVEKIANAVLYEGYVLYPYRLSAIKNQQRFNFGVLYPQEFCDVQAGTDSWEMLNECIIRGSAGATIQVKTRFLQLAARNEWQEGHEREILAPGCLLGDLLRQPCRQRFSFAGSRDPEGRIFKNVEGEVVLTAIAIGESLFRLTLRIRNSVASGNAAHETRDDALLRSMISVHSILYLSNGEFVSLLDPPDEFKKAVAGCQNRGAWPVLAGEDGRRDVMLCSPIILYDYPEIAPESPGDLCDGTEIDEILALRILTLTDDEKREVRNGDDRARRILERTEMLPPEYFQRLHGVLRDVRPNQEARQ